MTKTNDTRFMFPCFTWMPYICYYTFYRFNFFLHTLSSMPWFQRISHIEMIISQNSTLTTCIRYLVYLRSTDIVDTITITNGMSLPMAQTISYCVSWSGSGRKYLKAMYCKSILYLTPLQLFII